MRIRDFNVRRFTEQLSTTGSTRVDDQNVLQLLAAVGDSWRKSSANLLTDLTRPGISRLEQFNLANAGLLSHEKADLVEILDKSGYQMDPGAKNFLEALTGRAPLIETFGPLTIVGNQKDGIAGIAKPGDTIEAINLSTAPDGRLHLGDTMVIGQADAQGKFLGTLPDMKEGDVIRLRTRAADGTTSDWLTLSAHGIDAADTRNASVNLERLDLAVDPSGDGTITVTHNTARPLTEPGAMLRFTNNRDGQTFDVKATENGSIPEGFKLKGKPGDSFTVASSDGRNNSNFTQVAGTLRVPGGDNGNVGVDLPDPAPLKSDTNPDGTSKFKLLRFIGKLIVDRIRPGDVRQGAIGNCYFPAAMAAIAHADETTGKNRIGDMIRQNDDGTYTVKFFQRSWGGTPKPVEITVDGDLYVRSYGGLVYGSSLGTPAATDKLELWYPIIEKAYAQWKGGYEAIGNGGVSGQVMSEVLGARDQYSSISDFNKDRIYSQIKDGAEKGYPMTAGTYGTEDAERYTNTGVYANHAYSVLGVEEKDGVKHVKLRNPWGQSEPYGDGVNDGFFSMPLDKFAHLYQNFSYVAA